MTIQSMNTRINFENEYLEQNIHVNSKNDEEKNDYDPQFGSKNHLVLIACFVSYEKWASWGKKVTIHLS